MFHAITRMSIVGKVNEKSVGVEFGRSPHRRFGPYDLFNIANEVWPFAALLAQRMHDDAICFAFNFEIVFGPIGSNFSRVIDHDVPIWELKIRFVLAFCPAVYDAPALRGIDREADRILFVIDDVHKNATAVEVSMARVELRKS